jgi:hypothetical protein
MKDFYLVPLIILIALTVLLVGIYSATQLLQQTALTLQPEPGNDVSTLDDDLEVKPASASGMYEIDEDDELFEERERYIDAQQD